MSEESGEEKEAYDQRDEGESDDGLLRAYKGWTAVQSVAAP